MWGSRSHRSHSASRTAGASIQHPDARWTVPKNRWLGRPGPKIWATGRDRCIDVVALRGGRGGTDDPGRRWHLAGRRTRLRPALFPAHLSHVPSHRRRLGHRRGHRLGHRYATCRRDRLIVRLIAQQYRTRGSLRLRWIAQKSHRPVLSRALNGQYSRRSSGHPGEDRGRYSGGRNGVRTSHWCCRLHRQSCRSGSGAHGVDRARYRRIH